MGAYLVHDVLVVYGPMGAYLVHDVFGMGPWVLTWYMMYLVWAHGCLLGT